MPAGRRRSCRRGLAATATKVVAVVCCAAVFGGGAAELRPAPPAATQAGHPARASRATASAPEQAAQVIAPARMAADPLSTRERPPLPAPAPATRQAAAPTSAQAPAGPDVAPIRMTVPAETPTAPVPPPTPEQVSDQATAAASGGALAPPEDDAPADGTTARRPRPRRAPRAPRPPPRRRPADRPRGAPVSSRVAMEPYPATLEHEDLLVRRGRRSGLYCIVAVHSTVRGPAVGGCRMWRYDDSRAGVRDALKLSRAMTFKSAAAALPMGGGKGVIMLRGEAPTGRARTDLLLDFAETVDLLGGAYKTAEDVGTSLRDMTVIARGTPHVSGLSRAKGGSGDPSPWTAIGVEAAILASAERAFGSADLKGRTVSVVGLGHVGLRVAELVARRGAKLIVADIVPPAATTPRRFGARWISPAKALVAPADVLVPCALGGMLDHETVPLIQAQVIAGAANNQLADDALDAELAAARRAVGAGLRRQRRRHHQHLRRVRARRL